MNNRGTHQAAQTAPSDIEALAIEGLDYFERSGDTGDREYVRAIRSVLASRVRPTVRQADAEIRARELLAAEYDRDGATFPADCIRTDSMLTNTEARAIRAIIAAMKLEEDRV